MIKAVLDAVCIKLSEVYGDSHRIYTESVEQGLVEPCFFVQLVDASKRRLNASRQSTLVPLVIHHFSGTAEPDYDVADELFDVLNIIRTDRGARYRGTDFHIDTVDDVVQVFITYEAYADYVEQSAVMDSVRVQTRLKEG